MNRQPQASSTTSERGLPRRVWDFASAVAAFVADRGRTVSKEQYEARLSTCDSCEQRNGARCGACGCYLMIKAKGRAMQCPLNLWPPE